MSHPINKTIAAIRDLQHFHEANKLPACSRVHLPLDDAGALADYISRLEAVVRAADAIAHDLGVLLGSDYSPEEYAYDEARARVTLPPLTQTNQAKDGDKEDASNGK